jgi:hypothetical protein
MDVMPLADSHYGFLPYIKRASIGHADMTCGEACAEDVKLSAKVIIIRLITLQHDGR